MHYSVDLWFENESGIEKPLAELNDLELARIVYVAACAIYPKSVVTLRNCARVMNKRKVTREWR